MEEWKGGRREEWKDGRMEERKGGGIDEGGAGGNGMGHGERRKREGARFKAASWAVQ